MEKKEIKDLTVSALVLALAFSIMFSGGLRALHSLLILFPMSLITVSVGFVFHELAHRFTARRFGCFAEYRMWPFGLLLAVFFSFFGFIFAAPGAVMIRPRMDLWGFRAMPSKRENGLISIAGPFANIVLAGTFLLLYLPFTCWMFLLGARINTWLALFNLLPFPPLDGGKVFFWSKEAWLGVLLVVIAFVLYLGFR